MALYATASDDGAVQVHLGPNFPLTLTLKTATVDGKAWAQATWQTPGRQGTGWVEASALTMIQPSGGAMASFDALDTALADYLAGYGTRVGVELLDVTRGLTYTYNADRPYVVASSIKVPIMLALLTQLEAKGRRPNAKELSLLTTMIENSNNSSASALYAEIGYRTGLNAFMKKVGISGLTPHVNPVGWWGYSTITPAAMVSLLELLHEGKVLNAKDRALALKLMEHIQADQRVGAGDSSPAWATVALKDGWVLGPDNLYVMNSSGIITVGSETYIVAAYTIDDKTYGEGFRIVRHIYSIIGARMVGPSASSSASPSASPSPSLPASSPST